MSTEILNAIWGRSYKKGYYPYLAMIDRHNGDRFSEREWRFYPEGPEPAVRVPGQDHFFSPLLFDGDRKNKNAAPPGILYADMDNVREHKDQLDKIWPHILWMTSNENAQAVWFLRSAMPDLDAWADLNQRMTYFMGADKGGWHASKLLRIPGTHNWKYDPPQMGTVVSFQPKAAPYEAEALRADLPPVKQGVASMQRHPEPIPEKEWKSFVAKRWKQLPLRTRRDLLALTMPDRSRALVLASNRMRFAGIPPEDQFQILWWVRWNKFRPGREQDLWKLVSYGS